MEILIDDIPEEGLTIKADTDDDEWLKIAIKDAEGDRFTDKDHAKIVVTFLNFEGNIDIRGELTIVLHPPCDRCLKVYTDKKKIPFHNVMAPLYKSASQEEEGRESERELVREDLEFAYYEGDRIDLSDMVREQILLNESIKHLCSDDCKGICQRCGKDLNEGPCSCKEEHHDKRWDVLKKFKAQS